MKKFWINIFAVELVILIAACVYLFPANLFSAEEVGQEVNTWYAEHFEGEDAVFQYQYDEEGTHCYEAKLTDGSEITAHVETASLFGQYNIKTMTYEASGTAGDGSVSVSRLDLIGTLQDLIVIIATIDLVIWIYRLWRSQKKKDPSLEG
ncbi:MAG: hypothetical protein IJ443_07030 [Firmicutes bacterium]|nr:hypothetical protein [Bacillota bacterium]